MIRQATTLAANLNNITDQTSNSFYETFSDSTANISRNGHSQNYNDPYYHYYHHHHNHHNHHSQNLDLNSGSNNFLDTDNRYYCPTGITPANSTASNLSDLTPPTQKNLYSHQYQTRQDSLICFSMNFHANSIQVMTAPSSSTSSSLLSNGTSNANNEESTLATHHYQYQRHYPNLQNNSGNNNCSNAATGTTNNIAYNGNVTTHNNSGQSGKSICCYFSSENSYK